MPRTALARVTVSLLVCAVAGFAWQLTAAAQGRGGRAGGPPPVPRAAAPFDPTGYWVSLITEDWSFRMITPRKGNYRFIPLNQEARKVADTWDPARDESSGNACRAYGPFGLMRMPGRLKISWEDDSTLKVEADNGQQVRYLRFGPSKQPGAPTLQGHSVAQWETPQAARGIVGFNRQRPQGEQQKFGSLKVVTTGMKPGYLRKNGVPYSEKAVLTEYILRLHEDNGDEYLAITASLDDPQYLQRPFTRTVSFKRQPDDKGWNPTPCTAW